MTDTGIKKKKIFAAIMAACLIIAFVLVIAFDSGNYSSHALSDEVLTFSHESGCYDNNFSLSISDSKGGKIYYTLDGSVPVIGKSGTYEYSGSVAIKNLKGTTPILATDDNAWKFTDNKNSKAYTPSASMLDRATIVRAISFYDDGKSSPVSTRTYFVGNDITSKYSNCSVMSIVTDPSNLLDGTNGIYVRGDKYDSLSNSAITSSSFAELVNYMQSGRESERAAYIDFFNEGESFADVSQGVGIRIHGGYSRRFDQKSFNIYFRDEYEYGTKNLKGYDLIPGARKTYYDNTVAGVTDKTTKYANVMLRNGGNDWDSTKIQDLFIQRMVADKSFTTQAVRPCMLYLNGEYWGLYNLTEKYSDKYIEEEFAVDNNNVIVYKDLEIDEGEALDPDGNELDELLNLGNLDMTIEANYQKFKDIVDIDSYVDYMATEVYINNNDWWSGTNPDTPNNNLQFWKVADPSIENPANPYADGRWRYMLFDTEWSMGIYGNTQAGWSYDSIKYHAIGEPDRNLSSDSGRTENNGDPVFAALIKNSDFRKRFTNALLDLKNWNFEYYRSCEVLDEIADIYAPLMNYNNERWGKSFSYGRVDGIKDFLYNRADYVLSMIENNMPEITSSDRVNVTVMSNLYGKEEVKVNSVIPDVSSGWNAVYYRDYPITVSATEVEGYIFDHWEVSGGQAVDEASKTTDVSFTSSTATIKAIYTYSNGEAVPGPTEVPVPEPTDVVTSNINSGYVVEYAIPFQNKKSSGDRVGLELQVNDCTGDGMRYGTLNLFADNSPYSSGEEFGIVILSDSISSPKISQRTLTAIKTDEAVSVDGLIDSAWSKAQSVRLNHYQTDRGERHCNAVARLLWDEDNIYVLVIVEDDDMCTNTNTYQSDSVEIFYDEDAANPVEYEEDMFQYRTLYSGVNEFGKYSNNMIPELYDVKTAARLNGYYAEFAIPFDEEKQAGDKVDFELQVINSISSYTAGRVSKLNLFSTKSAYSDRRNFGTLQLCDAYLGDVKIDDASAYALRTDRTIEIDGMIEPAWFDSKPLDMTIYTPKTIDGVDYPQDINARARVLWDANNLYVLVIVDDNDICRHEGVESDSVEVFFDEDVSVDDNSTADYTPTAFQFRAYSDGILEGGNNYENSGYTIEAAASSVGTAYKIDKNPPYVEPTKEPVTTPQPTMEPVVTPQPTDIPVESGYKVTFVKESGVSITTYKTQDYSDEAGIAYNQTEAVARDSVTGKVDISGGGQINFTVVPPEGYEVETVYVDGSYKNIKGEADTGLSNTYRITKIAGNITVTVTTKRLSVNPVDNYKVSFITDGHVHITTYTTKNYDDEAGIAYNQTEAIVRDGDTGEADVSGGGQVNFTIVSDAGYIVKDVNVSPRYLYKNKKGPDETFKDYTYRITQISGDLTIEVVSEAVGGGAEGTPTATPAPTANPTPTPSVTPTVTPSKAPSVASEPVRNPSDVKPVQIPGTVKGIKLTAGTKKLIVKWKKLTGVTGYKIKYSLKKNFKGAKMVTVRGNKAKYVIKKLKARKYYVRICAYNTSGSGKWSKAYKAKVK